MSSTAASQSGLCARCHKDATKFCPRCKWTPDNFPGAEATKTYYCNSACQQEDWIDHKTVCKATQERKSLYRTGLIVQDVFYKFRERVFDKLTVKVERKEDVTYLYEGRYKSTLLPFPSELFPNEQERNAALVDLSCDDSVGTMREILETMLEGIYSDVAEVTFIIKNKRRRVISFNVLGAEMDAECNHIITRVTLKSGECYALDFTGAQYGYHEPVIPWDLYVDTRVECLTRTQHFGCKEGILLSDQDCAERSDLGDVRKLDRVFTMLLNEALDVWQKQNLSFSALLKLPEDTFQQRQSEFIRFLEWYLPTGRQVEKWYKSLPQDQEEIEVTEMYDEIRKII